MRCLQTIPAITALLAVSLPASADRIEKQGTFADLSKANTSAFVKMDTLVEAVNVSNPSYPIASMTFKSNKASFGQALTTPVDWSAYTMLTFRIANRESRTANFRFIVQLSSDPNNYTNAFVGTVTVPASSTRQFVAYLNQQDPLPYGLEYINPVLSINYAAVFSHGPFRDLRKIYHWRISHQDSTATRIHLADLRLLKQSLNFTGIADKYGQYTDRSWAGKITSDSQFASLKAAELTDLDAFPGKGEQLGTTSVLNPTPVPGKWAVVTASNGRKYLQHPNGRLFWSFGLNAISDSLHTQVGGREQYFQSLPSTTGRFAPAYGTANTPAGLKTVYSHRMQNLMIKYGDLYLPSWLDMVKRRLASWGVNTVGIDSHPNVMNLGIPYTVKLDTGGFSTRLSVPLSIWGSLPDPYASTFQSWCTSRFTSGLSGHTTKTQFMGAFVDNELSWGRDDSTKDRCNVGLGALVAPSTQPAKSALIAQLKAKYVTISSLNSSWGSSFSSWDSFASNRTWSPSSINTAMRTDLLTFSTAFAKKYFTQVRSALTSAGLKSLYLGCRFAHYTTEAAKAAALSADVVTFNLYRTTGETPWTFFAGLSKPVLVTELGFGTLDRCTFGGPSLVSSHSERAGELKAFLDRAVVEANVVGVHWYSYADQPITGRWSDYENAGLGVVDVADNPYSETVSTFRAFANGLYNARANGSYTGGSGGGGSGGGGMTGPAPA